MMTGKNQIHSTKDGKKGGFWTTQGFLMANMSEEKLLPNGKQKGRANFWRTSIRRSIVELVDDLVRDLVVIAIEGEAVPGLEDSNPNYTM